jgi:hypothetical protein
MNRAGTIPISTKPDVPVIEYGDWFGVDGMVVDHVRIGGREIDIDRNKVRGAQFRYQRQELRDQGFAKRSDFHKNRIVRGMEVVAIETCSRFQRRQPVELGLCLWVDLHLLNPQFRQCERVLFVIAPDFVPLALNLFGAPSLMGSECR